LDTRSSSVFDVFAGLHFENEPGLTELDAAEGRRNRLSRRIRRSESAGPTGQLLYEGIANGGHLVRPEDKDELDFSELAMLFMPMSQPPE